MRITFFFIYIFVLLFNLPVYSEDKSLNAAYMYREANKLLTELPEDFGRKSAAIIEKGLDIDDTILKVVSTNQKAISLFKEATKLEKCDFSFGESMNNIDIDPPHYSYVHDFVRLLLIQAIYYEKQNQLDLAFDNYLSVLRFIDHLEEQDNFIILAKVWSIVSKELFFLAVPSYLKDLGIDKVRIFHSAFLEFEGNLINFEDALVETREHTKHGIRLAGKIMKKEQKPGEQSEVFLDQFYQEADRIIDEYFGYFIDAHLHNDPDRNKEKRENFLKILVKENNRINIVCDTVKAYWESFKIKMGISKSSEKLSNIMAKRIAKILTTIAIPRITFFSTDYYLSQVKFDILSCAIAVKLYENELGNLPEDLSQLKSRYFDQLPKDPFNQFKDLSYKKTNYGWVVYSFGPDKKDDSAGIAYKGSGDIKPGDIFFKGYIDFLDKFGGSNVNQ